MIHVEVGAEGEEEEEEEEIEWMMKLKTWKLLGVMMKT
jgi:hypothetical protein